MSRCCVCDYSQEFHGGRRQVKWNDKVGGFQCETCEAEITEALLEFNEELLFDKNTKDPYDEMARTALLEIRNLGWDKEDSRANPVNR